MIVLRITDWGLDEDDNLEHVRTTWQASLDSDFTNIADELTSDKYLEIYYCPLVTTTVSSVYIRCKRIFNDDSESDWKIKEVSALNYKNNNLNSAYNVDVAVIKPTVSIALVGQDYVMTTSNFATFTTNNEVEDAHAGTLWIISSDYGQVYINDFDTVNLTTLTIPVSDFKIGTTTIYVTLAHIGVNGGVSPVTEFEVLVNTL